MCYLIILSHMCSASVWPNCPMNSPKIQIQLRVAERSDWGLSLLTSFSQLWFYTSVERQKKCRKVQYQNLREKEIEL